MIILDKWLKSFFKNKDICSKEIEKALCSSGTETTLRKLHDITWEENLVVVAEILEAEPHPNADRLKVCKVSDGTNILPIVCGAKNARKGIKVALAKVGAELPGNFNIKKSKIRSEVSEGMLCAASEIGLEDSIDGIMELSLDLELGLPITQVLELNDYVFDCEITANRSDCLGVFGIAREAVASIEGLSLETPFIPVDYSSFKEKKVPLSLKNGVCSKYSSTIIEEIDCNIKTPSFIQKFLLAGGIKLNNIIVDIGNYVMLETGQPIHAFNLDKIDGGLTTRISNSEDANNKIVVLGGKEYKIQEGTLITEDNSKIVALTGIIGSLDTSCDTNTTRIILEIASLNKECMANKARSYGLHTEASYRFERGVDDELVCIALDRFLKLLCDFTNAKINKPVFIEEKKETKKPIEVLFSTIENVIGTQIDNKIIVSSLCKLGFDIEEENTEGFKATAPSYRDDVSIEEDIIEEVVRMYGIDNIPNTPMKIAPKIKSADSDRNLINDLIDKFSLGFNEVLNYSFLDKKTLDITGSLGLEISNPISKNLSNMRSSILPSLLLNIKHNIANSYQKDICLFEIANVFIGDKNDLSQSNFLSGIVAKGKVGSWTNKTKCEFYWLKEFISNTLNSLGIGGLIFKDGENKSFYHPSQCAKILSKGEEVATMGFIHPVILQKLKITTQVIYFEINIEKLFSALKKSRCNNSLEISKMPLINRDFSFIAKVDFPYSKLEAMLKKTGGRNLQEIILFDVYSGKPLESDEKSFAIRCVWQDKKKTLSDEDINSYVACILERAKKEGLVLRDS